MAFSTLADRLDQSPAELVSDCVFFLCMSHGIVQTSLDRLQESALFAVRDLLQLRIDEVHASKEDFNELEEQSSKIDSCSHILGMLAGIGDDKALWGALELLDRSKDFLDLAIEKQLHEVAHV